MPKTLALAGRMAAAPPAAVPAPPAPPSVKQLFQELLLAPLDKSILNLLPELGHLAPVILTMGLFFMSFITLNSSLFFFGTAAGEAFLLENLLSLMAVYTADPTNPPNPKAGGKACKSYFQELSPSRFYLLMGKGLREGFPNSPLYYISFAAAYATQSLAFFTEESSELGPQYSNRPYIALIAAAMFILLYMIYMLAYGCSGFFSLVMSAIAGILVGLVLAHQNNFLFGKENVNLLFIAPLAKRTGMDFVCVTTQAAS